MQVSVESVGNLQRKMTVQVPAERIQTEVDKRLRSLVKRVRIDGFRPGKVPFKVVEKRYGEGVYQEVLGDVLQSSYQEALIKEKIVPAGAPEIDTKSVESGQPLEYVATFEVFPEVKLGKMGDIKVKKPKVSIAAEDVDKVIESLRKQRREWADVERKAADGDQIVVDFVGRVDGEVFEGGSAEDAAIELGAGRMIPGFEEQLKGLAAGAEKTIKVDFPEEYPAKHLAGKAAEFDITVKKVQEPSLPEVNAAFAKAFGVEKGGVKKLREEVKANMERELGQTIKTRVKDQVMDALYDTHSLDVPQSVVKEEINRLREQVEARFGGGQGSAQLPDEHFEKEAQRRVVLGLVIREIIRSAKIKPDTKRIDAELQAMAAGYEHPEQVIAYYRGNQEAMSGLESVVLEQQVVDWVVDQCKLTEETMSFEALMNPSEQEQA